MEYKVIVEKIDSIVSRDVAQAAADLSAKVNGELARGWEPLGSVAIGSAGTAPYLLQAMLKRR